MVDAWIKAQAYRLYTWGTVTRLADGGDMGAAGSVNKVFWSELDIALHETALDLLGPEAELESTWLDGYTFSLSGPIYAGTNEIQRNIVAERILGLPREVRAMRFELDSDQRDFAASLESLLASADTAAVARAWADGDHDPGLKLWARLAEQGVTMLATDATPVEVVIAFEALGRHAVPGPWVESAAYLPVALGREVEGVATVAVPPHVPYALDADVADEVYVGSTLVSEVGAMHTSVDRTRRLFEVAGCGAGRRRTRPSTRPCSPRSAQLLGLGERILADSVTYVKQRKQFGREIGSYQAIKHALADVRIALDFARPLVYGAALDEVSALGRQGRGRRRGVPRLPDRPPGARRDRLHRRVRPEHLADQGAGAGDGVGHAGVPPGARARGAGGLMEFAFSEEQQELASTVRSLLAKRADSAAVRAAMESEAGYDEALWQTLCEQIGVAALGIPEEYDGAGFSLFESLIVLEELGRSLAPSPLLASLVTAEAVLAGADDEAKAAAAAPDRRRRGRGAVHRRRPGALRRPGHRARRASVTTTSWSSTRRRVTRNGCHPWTKPAVLRISTRPGARAIGDGEAARERALLVGAVGVAALQAGLAARALEMTVEYSQQRVQFGRPIGSFQALKHRMADMLVLVEMSPLGVVGGVVRRLDPRRQRRAARARREVLLHRRAEPDRRRDRPAARRHRDHLGARRPAGLQARPRAGPAVRRGARAPGADRPLADSVPGCASSILGAGFGGLELASTLSARARRDADVVLVDQADGFVFGFSKLDVMFGKAPADHVRHSYADLAHPGVRFVQHDGPRDRPGRAPGRDRRRDPRGRRAGGRARRRPAPRRDARAGRGGPRVLHGGRRLRAARRARELPRRPGRGRRDVDPVQVPARAERDRAAGRRPAARPRRPRRLRRSRW